MRGSTGRDWLRRTVVDRLGLKSQQVTPIDDLRPHAGSRDCWCRPLRDEFLELWLHNALDGRELYETGERRLS